MALSSLAASAVTSSPLRKKRLSALALALAGQEDAPIDAGQEDVPNDGAASIAASAAAAGEMKATTGAKAMASLSAAAVGTKATARAKSSASLSAAAGGTKATARAKVTTTRNATIKPQRPTKGIFLLYLNCFIFIG